MDTVVSIDKEKIAKPTIPSWPASNASRSNAGWQPGVQLFLRLSGWVCGPVLIAVAVGKYLDAQYHTDPWLFLFSVGGAFFVSMWALIHYGIKEINRIEKEFPPKDSNGGKK